ncbi:MAG: hypothetical protein U0U67_11085 [Chitinophagales bacterium]
MSDNPFNKASNFSPVKQGLFTFGLVSIIALLCAVFSKPNRTEFGIILSPIFLYCFFNPFLGALSKHLGKYILQSIAVFFALGIYIVLLGCFVTHTKFSALEELQSIILLVFVLYFLVNFLGLVFRGLMAALNVIDQH